MKRRLLLGGGVALAGCATAAPAQPVSDAGAARLVAAYPDHLASVEGDTLIWRDGTRMPIGAREPARDFETMLRSATIADQLRQSYVAGPMQGPPRRDHSPGRLRNAAFFERMYGDCRRGETARHLRPVTWMPRTRPQTLLVTTVNDVASRLERVIATLETLRSPIIAGLLVMAALVIVTGYTSINAVVKAELFPANIRALGVALPYALANTLFGGTAEYVALSFKNAGWERGFYWYVTGMIAVSLVIYIRMRDTRATSRISED